MKKCNTGFTLVEILSILAVLGIIVMLILPNLGGSIDEKKENELNKLIAIIENSAKVYHSFNSDVYKIKVSDLVEEKYITTDLIDPKSGGKLDGCVSVTLDEEGIYDYNYASCESVEVPFSVELNGGTPSQTFNTKYLSSTKIELLDPVKEESEFEGWEIVKGNSILKGDTLVIGTTETILWAKWSGWPKLTINLNEGSISQEFKNSYKSGTIITLETPEKEGYIFTGWEVTSGNGYLSGNDFTMGSSDVTITANFEPLVIQAIYSETDNSLIFINDIQQVKGNTYNGKVITEVYTGFVTKEYDETAVPWYSYRSVIKRVDFIDEVKPTSLKNWFRSFSACTEMNLKKLNTVNVTTMEGTFQNCSALTTLDISNFNTSSVTNMNSMFSGCSKLTSLNISSFNTINVTDMAAMFQNCSALTTLDISNFNTSNVNYMNYMFDAMRSLTILDISGFNTINVTDMRYMFQFCDKLTMLDLSHFNTINVTKMVQMFYYTGSQASTFTLNLGNNFNTSNVTDMSQMFYYIGWDKVTTLTLNLGNSFNPLKITNMKDLFYGVGYNSTTCSIDLGEGFDTSNVTNMENMFNRACSMSTTTTINLGSKFDTSNVANMNYMFEKVARNNANFVLDLGDKFKFKEGVTVNNFADSAGAGKLIIPETVTNIPNSTFKGMTKLKEIVFEHPSTSVITLPTAGSSTGAFYTSTVLNTTVTTSNQNVKNYAWSSDNRTVTFN